MTRYVVNVTRTRCVCLVAVRLKPARRRINTAAVDRRWRCSWRHFRCGESRGAVDVGRKPETDVRSADGDWDAGHHAAGSIAMPAVFLGLVDAAQGRRGPSVEHATSGFRHRMYRSSNSLQAVDVESKRKRSRSSGGGEWRQRMMRRMMTMLIVVVMMILLIMVMVVRIVRNAISAVHRWRQSQSSWSVRERSATVIVSSVFFLFRFLNRCFLSIVSCVHVLLVFYCNLLTGEMCTINICCCNTPAGPERRNIFFTKWVHVSLCYSTNPTAYHFNARHTMPLCTSTPPCQMVLDPARGL